MAFVRKCPKCGLDLTDPGAQKCPVCGAPILALPRIGVWLAALFQIAITTIFMLVFGFPKIMIVVFSALILVATAFSRLVKPRSVPPQSLPKTPVSNPILFKILGFAIALCSLAMVCVLVFGFAMFMNSWMGWQRYAGQPHHRSEFQVVRAYYQPHRKGGADVYASGMVDGQKEWMSLGPYLKYTPHDQEELDSRVEAGTTIPIYLYPGLKGRARVQVYNVLPPDEANRRTAMSTLSYGLIGLAVSAGVIFLLSRVRRTLCVEENSFELPGIVQNKAV
jgi:hypothetical protein